MGMDGDGMVGMASCVFFCVKEVDPGIYSRGDRYNGGDMKKPASHFGHGRIHTF